MTPSVYSYGDYKLYIQERIRNHPSGSRGVKSALAKAVQCQKPYLTHVLSGDAHFNADQTILAANFFNLDAAETDYLLHLVLAERASQRSLRAYYQNHLNHLLNNFYLLKNRVRISTKVSTTFKNTYYSTWHYTAIHMIVTIPEYRTVPKIARRLNIEEAKVSAVLETLAAANLVKATDEGYLPTEKAIFVGSDEPQVTWLHRNWRAQAAQRVEQNDSKNLHTSLVLTLSRRDYIEVREKIKNTISEVIETTKLSNEEEICALVVDYFAL